MRNILTAALAAFCVLVSAPAAALNWRAVATGLVLLALAAGFAAWVVANQAQTARQSTSVPLFSDGAAVRVVVPDGRSTSVLRGCPAGFWMGVVGLATDGATAQVIARTECDNTWWYEISLPESASSAWDGQGWINGAYLKPR